jgi:SAM-dependent methyltransferase
MSFGTVADDYDRLRPPPPDTAVDWLLPAACQVAIDLGAGTGLLSRALARRVPRVVAVEPDDRMAAVLRASSAGAGGTAAGGTAAGEIAVVPGRGEAIPMPDASADAVFVSSAWQWMDPQLTTAEVARVLRDGGRFGLIWTGRDREVGWVRELDALREPRQDDQQDDRQDDTEHRPGRPWGAPTELPDGLFGPVQLASFTFMRTMTVDDVIAMLATYSGLITASPQDAAEALARARAALDQRFPGAEQIDVPMRSRCFRADRLSRP